MKELTEKLCYSVIAQEWQKGSKKTLSIPQDKSISYL